MELPLGEAAPKFDLETAVCSHGLFMLSPNHWNPLTKSLTRPLHLTVHSNSPPPSITVTISQPHQDPHSLRIKLHKTPSASLSNHQQDALVRQVVRMLRLSESDERNVREFKRVASEVGEGCDFVKDFSGRVFRSPTLFEDMVKCMLLCNCQLVSKLCFEDCFLLIKCLIKCFSQLKLLLYFFFLTLCAIGIATMLMNFI